MDTGGYGEGSGSGGYTSGSANIESYLAVFICPTLAGERDTDQLPGSLAGALVDTDDADLPGTCAEPDWESGGGALAIGGFLSEGF